MREPGKSRCFSYGIMDFGFYVLEQTNLQHAEWSQTTSFNFMDTDKIINKTSRRFHTDIIFVVITDFMKITPSFNDLHVCRLEALDGKTLLGRTPRLVRCNSICSICGWLFCGHQVKIRIKVFEIIQLNF